MTRQPPRVTVEGFYAIYGRDGRAILREKRGDALVWIIRTRAQGGGWDYALCTDESEPKPILGYVELSVITARLARVRSLHGQNITGHRLKMSGSSVGA